MKLGIVIPAHGSVSLEWSIYLANLLKHTSVSTEVFVSRHYNIDAARQDGVMAARNAGATHLLFIDTDIIPMTYQNNQFVPFVNAIDFMLSYHYPVVSGLYLSKKDFKPAVYEYTGNEDIPFKPTDKKFEDFVNKVSFVPAVGLGFCLVDARVFDILENNGYFPFFQYKRDYTKKTEISEDLYFMNLLRKFGFSVMLLGQIACIHLGSAKFYPNAIIEYAPIDD
jgi:hypothetical protein